MVADAILVVFVAVWRHCFTVAVIIVAAVLVAPAIIALATSVVALPVVTTTFFAVDAVLIFDC